MPVFLKFSFLILALSWSAVALANKNISYLQKVYAAEEAIMSGREDAALQLYLEAFEVKKENLFAEDIFNALKCSFSIKHKSKSDTLLQLLAQTGVGEKFIRHHFEKYYQDNRRDNFNKICKEAASAKNRFEAKNKEINLKLKELYDEDQYYHKLWAEHSRSIKIDFNKIEEDSVHKAMSEADIRISKALKALYDGGNSLSEFQLGAYVREDGSLGFKRDYSIIIMHNFQGFKSADTLFNTVLLQQIENGYIKPIYFSTLSDANNNQLKKDYGDAAVYIAFQEERLFYNKYVYGATDWSKELNQNRASIHLFSLNKQLERFYFNLKFNQGQYIIRTASFWSNAEIDAETYNEYVS